MYVRVYVTLSLGMHALRANVRITCVGVCCITGRANPACVYILTACSATRMQLTERRHDKRPTGVKCATIDRQAHLNLARRRQYRAWVSLYTSYDVLTCIALRHHLREAFTAYT